MDEQAELRSRVVNGILGGLAFGTVLVEADLNIAWVSAAVPDLIGRPVSEIVGVTALDLIHPDDVAGIVDLALAEIESPSPFGTDPSQLVTNTVRLRHGDGTWHTFEFAANSQLTNPDVRGFVLMLRDATDDQLRSDVMSLIAAGAPIGDVLGSLATMLEWQIRGAIVRVGAAVVGARRVEVTLGEMPEREPDIFVRADDADSSEDIAVWTPNGKVSAWSRILTERALQRLQVAVASEVSRHVVALKEARLRSSELVSNAGSCELDANGRSSFWSDGLRRLAGIDADTALRGDEFDRLVHPDDRDTVRTALMSALSTGQPLSIEHRIVLAGGVERLVRLVGGAMTGFGGDRRLVFSVRDVTDETREREQLQRAQRLDSIGRLAGGLAHDLNNLLTVLIGHANLLSETVTGEDAESVEAIRQASDRAATLTRQLLGVARRDFLRPEVLRIERVLHGQLSTFRQVLPPGVVLDVRMLPDLPPVFIDVVKLEQVLLNVVLNAADAIELNGRVVIETSVVDVVPGSVRAAELLPGRYVLVEIVDDGVGMSRDVLARAMEPFFTTKPRDRGNGLGLSTSYGILRQSGGLLSIDSDEGRGTTVRLYLPITSSPDAPDEPVVPSVGIPAGTTVLVVEDQDTVRDIVASVLRRAGCAVLTAVDGPDGEAVAAAHPGPIDIMVSDVSMPGFDGVELARRVALARPDTRIVLMSGYTDDSAMLAAVTGTGMRLMTKPFTPNDVLVRIAEVLASR